MNDIEELEVAVKALSSKKAEKITALKVKDITVLANYFVIASGTSSTQVKALADEVEYELSQKGIEPSHIEGRATGWILLDYSSVIVHVFTGESREYYNLERLWSDAAQIDISDIADNRD